MKSIFKCFLPILVIVAIFSNITASASTLPNTFTLNNLIVNGGFETGVEGWSTSNATITFDNNQAMCVALAPGGYVNRTPSLTYDSSHYYYVRTDIKASSSTIRVRLGGNFVSFATGLGEWETISDVVNSSVALGGGLNYSDVATSNYSTFWVDNGIVCDLTTTFGVGNIPTKAQMDSIVTQWFDTSCFYDITPTTTVPTTTSTTVSAISVAVTNFPMDNSILFFFVIFGLVISVFFISKK